MLEYISLLYTVERVNAHLPFKIVVNTDTLICNGNGSKPLSDLTTENESAILMIFSEFHTLYPDLANQFMYYLSKFCKLNLLYLN